MQRTEADAGLDLSVAAVDPLRYDGHDDSRWEVGGMILRRIPSGARVLDVGCGTGSLAVLLRDRLGVEVVGVEPHEERARRANERGIRTVTGVFSEALVAAHGQFDVVVVADVLEHLSDPAALLRALRAALRPGGRVLASVPNVAHWSVRRNLLLGRFDYEQWGIMDATHLRWFTSDSVRRLFEGAGYEVQSLDYTAGASLPVYDVARPWRWMSRYARTAVLRRLVRVAPGLVGCQFVIVAVPRARAS